MLLHEAQCVFSEWSTLQCQVQSCVLLWLWCSGGHLSWGRIRGILSGIWHIQIWDGLHQVGLGLLEFLVKVCVGAGGWRLTGVNTGWLVGLAGVGLIHTASFYRLAVLWSSSFCSLRWTHRVTQLMIGGDLLKLSIGLKPREKSHLKISTNYQVLQLVQQQRLFPK